MTWLLGALVTLLCLSIGLNLWLYAHRKAPLTREQSADARAILHDLTAYGNAMVRITRVSPEDVFLRSPRS